MSGEFDQKSAGREDGHIAASIAKATVVGCLIATTSIWGFKVSEKRQEPGVGLADAMGSGVVDTISTIGDFAMGIAGRGGGDSAGTIRTGKHSEEAAPGETVRSGTPPASASPRPSASATETPGVTPSETPEPTQTEAACRARVGEADTRRLIGRSIMWPVNGDGTSYNGTLDAGQTLQFFKDNQLGGALVVKPYPGETIKRLASADEMGWQLVVAADDESREIDRTTHNTGVNFPTAQEMSAMPLENVRQIAAERGRILKAHGINTALAPVTDKPNADNTSAIGRNRIFGETAEKIAAYAGFYAGGLKQSGVNPVYKHFLGGKMTKNTDLAPGSIPGKPILKQDDLRVFMGDNGKKLAINERTGVMHNTAKPEGNSVISAFDPEMIQLAEARGFQWSTSDDLGTEAVNQFLSTSFVDAWKAGVTMPLWVKNSVSPDATAQDQFDNIVKAAETALNKRGSGLTKETFVNNAIKTYRFLGLTTCDLATSLGN